MPYALFDGDTKISKSYPSASDVLKHAKETGLVVDKVEDEENPEPEMVLDNHYRIKECEPTPGDSPRQNEQVAKQQAKEQPYMKS